MKRTRVDRLARAAGGDEHAQSRPAAIAVGARIALGLRGERGLDRGEQRGRLGQPADPPLARRAERAGAGLEHGRAACAQRGEVRLRRGMLVHRVVHRRREHERAPARERGRAEQVVGLAGGELRERVGRGGRDGEHVGGLGEPQVRERRVSRRRVAGERAAQRVGLPLGDQHGGAGDRGERRRADEARGRLGLDHAHAVTGLRRQSRQLERLVGRDPTGDAKEDSRHRAGRLTQPR